MYRSLKLSLLLLLLSAIFTLPAFALDASANAAVNGLIKDKANGETLIGAVVQISGTKRGAVTNKSGFYSISKLKPGTYTLNVSYVGYSDISKSITLKKNETLRLNLEMEVSSTLADEVIVTAERVEDKREISISKINVPMQTIKDIKIGGESDVFRSLQLLPGVLTSSQISSGLFIRGGSPDQNLVLLDGATVYNPSHLFGFISTFNTDAVKDVELIKGAYPAQYGNRLSAVLNLTQKDGNRSRVEGLASLGILSSRLFLQGPLFNGSFMVSGRTSYFDLVKKLMTQDPTSPMPDFGFYDINAKITQDIGDDDKIFISGFLSKDNLGISNLGLGFDMGLSNRLLSARWNKIWGKNFFSNVLISYSDYDNTLAVDQSGYIVEITNRIKDCSNKINFEWFIGDDLTVIFGNELNFYHFTFNESVSGEGTTPMGNGNNMGKTDIDMYEVNQSAFAHINWQATALLSVQAGLRGYYWMQSDKVLMDPRFAVRYQLGEDTYLKASWGIFHQSLRLAALQDLSFFDTWLPTDSTSIPQYSQHYILSLETPLFDFFNFSADLYYKTMDNIGILNTSNDRGNRVKDVFEFGGGHAYGMEIFFQKQVGSFTGWIGYAYGRVNLTFPNLNDGEPFRPKYDRTHDLKLVVQYTLNKSWDFGANFTFQSGQSYTGGTSRFITKGPSELSGHVKLRPSALYALRLPNSHQLNLNVGYNHKFFGLNARTSLDIYNVYNRRDIWFRNYTVDENMKDGAAIRDVLLLPILPSLSIEVRF